MPKSQLEASVKNGELQITIDIDALCHSVAWGLEAYYDQSVKITSRGAFAVEIMHELLREDAEGATLVHKMFDQAANNAIENGCEGVEDD